MMLADTHRFPSPRALARSLGRSLGIAALSVILALAFACSGGGSAAPAPPTPPAPLGPRVVYNVYTPIPGTPNTQMDLWSMNPDGTGAAPLANDAADEQLVYDASTGVSLPVVAAGRLVYTGAVTAGNPGGYYSVKLDGTGTVSLTSGSKGGWLNFRVGDRLVFSYKDPNTQVTAGGFSVNIDGTGRAELPADADLRGQALGRIFYNSALPSGSLRFYSALPDGTSRVELLPGPGDLPVTWTPRQDTLPITVGTKLLFARSADHITGDVYFGAPDGGAPVKLASGATFASGQSIGYLIPSALRVVGNRLAYLVQGTNTYSVHSVALDGSAPTTHGDLPGTWGGFTVSLGNQVFLDGYTRVLNETAVLGFDVTTTQAPAILARKATTAFVLGNRLACVVTSATGSDLVTLLPDGSSPLTLAAGFRSDAYSHGDYLPPFPLVGSRLLYRKDPGAMGNPDNSEMFAVNTDGSAPATLAAGPDAKAWLHLEADRLFFVRYDATYHSRFFSEKYDGTGLQPLTDGTTFDRYCGVAGSRLYFTRRSSQYGAGTLWVSNLDGTGAKALTSSGDVAYFLGVF